MTPNRLASERGQVRMPLDMRVTLRDHGLYVAAVASVVQAPSRVDVLPRHRPPVFRKGAAMSVIGQGGSGVATAAAVR